MDFMTKAGLFGIIASAIVALVFKWQNKRLKRKNTSLEHDNKSVRAEHARDQYVNTKVIDVIDDVDGSHIKVKKELGDAKTINRVINVINDIMRKANDSKSSKD